MSNLAINYDRYPDNTELVIVETYEEQFADLPDMVTSRDAAKILNVAGIQGVHYVIEKESKVENAPKVDIDVYQIGKKTYNRYSKAQLIALRRFRDNRNES